MKYYSISGEIVSGKAPEDDYKKAHAIGNLRIGDEALFFRARLKTYYVPYEAVKRCFRRVRLVPARMCCGRGDLAVESMVICDESGEIADIQMPGEKAGKLALEELKRKIPGAVFTAPLKNNQMGD